MSFRVHYTRVHSWHVLSILTASLLIIGSLPSLGRHNDREITEIFVSRVTHLSDKRQIFCRATGNHEKSSQMRISTSNSLYIAGISVVVYRRINYVTNTSARDSRAAKFDKQRA